MIHALVVGAMALTTAALAGFPAVALLRRLRLGKAINPWGPQAHQAKAGTPTMGGVVIWGAALAFAAFELTRELALGLPMALMAGLGVVGLVDDLGSLQGRREWALNKRLKLALFLLGGLGAGFVIKWQLDITSVAVPFVGDFELGWWTVPAAVAVVTLTAGGVAVTDGLDGLAAGCCVIAYLAYGIIGLAQGQEELAAFALVVAGAALGFLWHNAHPAQVFMGDTGALALGGGLAALALLTGQWLVLPIIGIVFVLEGASVYLQVGYYRLTGGRRLFRMAPLHHHFEALGWPEPKVVQRFWLLAALGALVGTALALEGVS
ncbi:MAG: phospho-N-acetylmuramoyl-pentapeptide-transferase [Dehalococcoidia bacterium]|jgi:phospho-N-acetylmuramoyl-pentapeptide-transferase|nr:phospho-N-acetylmuramoyl-pentapeptide-transferase [Dehalococcoidia bacterium]MDW8009869.1 phospho-N-acetylmuramoyl-pentapeptide-transferase [Chloroflexota bacterium]